MKKTLLILLLCAPFIVSAQSEAPMAKDTSYWNVGGISSLAFSQVSLTNWAAGGDNSVSMNGYLNIFADYKKDRSIWENSLELGYGLIKQGNASFEKSDDKINLTTKYGRQLSADNSKWYWSMNFNLRTQFAKGFSADNPDEYISKFMAPGYMIIALGLDYKPSDYFSISYAPLTGKITIVNDNQLSAVGAFGVDPGSTSRKELGSYLTAKFKKDILENVNLESNIQLFSNYADNPQDIDVNWENVLVMKINSFLSTSIINQLIYDKDIDIAEFDENGDEIGSGPKVQFKNILGVGVTVKFGQSK